MRSKNGKKSELVQAILDAYQPETAEDGHKSGFEDGHIKGKKEKEIEMVKKMLAAGVEVSIIKKCSTLSEEEITALKMWIKRVFYIFESYLAIRLFSYAGYVKKSV